MKRLALILLFALAPAAIADDRKAVATVLDKLHEMASKADWDGYFSLFAEDAHFIGTDASEYWTVAEFRSYASGASNGWTYNPVTRQISLSARQDTAWFHEILHNEKYGTSRGTGVLTKVGGSWKISQYHLTFPIPNDLTLKVTDEIRAWKARSQNK